MPTNSANTTATSATGRNRSPASSRENCLEVEFEIVPGHPEQPLVGDAPPGGFYEDVGMIACLPDGGEPATEDLVLVREVPIAPLPPHTLRGGRTY
jgi:hypothetical protein